MNYFRLIISFDSFKKSKLSLGKIDITLYMLIILSNFDIHISFKFYIFYEFFDFKSL